MKKFMTVVGNRPQLVKLDKEFNSILVYTGQHYSRSLRDLFFDGLHIKKPDYDLKETELGPMIQELMVVMEKEKPDYVIVYGDTRTTYAGALAAYYLNIKIIHIEAGCRSGNSEQIEERIRRFVDSVATLHLAPSESCKERLVMEGHQWVANVGATQIDAMWSTFPTKRPKDAYEYYVLTVHREENLTKEKLEMILKGLAGSPYPVYFYVHPRTKQFMKKNKITTPNRVILKEPLGYKQMINRIAFAKKVITDSGGLQVEAYFLRRPCITLRNETEWIETVDLGYNVLVGTDSARIESELLRKSTPLNSNNEIYGYGKANKKIRILLEAL